MHTEPWHHRTAAAAAPITFPSPPRCCVPEGGRLRWSRHATPPPPPGRPGNCVENDLHHRRCCRLAWRSRGGKRRRLVFQRVGAEAGARLLHRGPPSSTSCCCCCWRPWQQLLSHCRPALSTSSYTSVKRHRYIQKYISATVCQVLCDFMLVTHSAELEEASEPQKWCSEQLRIKFHCFYFHDSFFF